MYFKKQITSTLISMTVCLFEPTASAAEQTSQADINNKPQVEHGKKVYQRFCSLCHGKNLEGQPHWHIRNADGKLPAPPHDESGHTWHHSDMLLFNMTKFGLVPPYAPEGYKSDMPAWKDTLSDEDIWAIIAYIKSSWPQEIREAQAQMNQ